jgi:hypothetical protein
LAVSADVSTGTRIVNRKAGAGSWRVDADICVVGSGAAGMAAALQAARLGRKVVLVDGLPALGGQAVNAIIGTFCGLYSNGPNGYRFTHGIVDKLLDDLGSKPRTLFYERKHTVVVFYDEIALSRWIEEEVRKAGITVIVGAVLRRVALEGRRVQELEIATRYGDVKVRATGYIDASGDAALTWLASFDCREPEVGTVYGTQMVVLEHIDEKHYPPREEITARMKEKGDEYGLFRRECFPFLIPGRGIVALNMTHIETPLDPLKVSEIGLTGKNEADKAVDFLKKEFSPCFGNAAVRAYGLPGVRQTRWIVGKQQLTIADVRAGTRFADAIGRTAWPVELHDHSTGHVWQTFDEDHVHYIPLGAMIPKEAENLVAAGRCIDGDKAALSSVRVMGPCMAEGMAAAHALDLAGTGSVQQIDLAALGERVRDNVERRD